MKKNIGEVVKEEFSLTGLLLIPVVVAINMVGFQIVQMLKLPIFLDQIGTILIGAIGGPFLSIAAAVVTNLINGIFNPVYFYYTPAAIVIGLSAALLSKFGFFKSFGKVIVAGIIVTFISIIVTTPITVLVFGGSTGSSGSIITSVFLATGQEIQTAVFSSTFIQEVIDKLMSLIVVFIIANKIPAIYISKLRYGNNIVVQKVNFSDIDDLYN